jgi:hypothetical protein
MERNCRLRRSLLTIARGFRKRCHFTLLTMLHAIGEIIAGIILEALVWIVLWPVVIIISTPFVLINACFSALSHQQRFRFAVADGYSIVSDSWKEWVF